MTTHVVIYKMGLVHCSVCAPTEMTRDEVAQSVNLARPNGTDKPWHISSDATFTDGLPHPRACDQDSTRRHWLLDC